MSRVKKLNKKLRLAKQSRRTKWAPFWIIPKIFGRGRRVHPGRRTAVKRNWRRSRIKA